MYGEAFNNEDVLIVEIGGDGRGLRLLKTYINRK